MRDIESTDINIDAARKLEEPRKVSVNTEPEPEIINTMSPPDEVANASATVTAPNQFTSHQIAVTQGTSDEITEDLEDDNYSQDNDFENEEEKSIKEIRREELRKNIFEKDEKRLTDYLNLRRVSQLEQQLKTKDKQIK